MIAAVIALLALSSTAAAVVTEQSEITYVGDGDNAGTNFYGTLPAQLGANPLYGVIATFPEIPGTVTGITITFSTASNFDLVANFTVYALDDAVDVANITFTDLPTRTYVGSTTPAGEALTTYDIDVAGTLTNGVYIIIYADVTTYLYDIDNVSVTSVTTSTTTTSTTTSSTTTTAQPTDPDHTVFLAVAYTIIAVTAIVALAVYVYMNPPLSAKPRGVYTKLT